MPEKEKFSENKSFISFKEKNTNLFLIIASVVLTVIAIYLLYSVLDKSGIINFSKTETVKPQNVQQLIQVEVLNGCGVAGVGDGLTDILRAKGI
ncbi:MAG: LytR C-terminal domain-containing protein, partial [Ignavibacteria bacterium]|nr:LytR C-terminal domain-containing protein [Ignavibacteria bacterium]